jgi:hypothetical protein
MKLFELITQPAARTEPVTPPGASIKMSPVAVALSKSDQMAAVKQTVAAIPQPDQALFQQVLHMILGDVMKNNPGAAMELLNSHIKASQQGSTNPKVLNFKAQGGTAAWEAMAKFIAAAKNPRIITVSGKPVQGLVTAGYIPDTDKLTLLENLIEKILR